MTLFPTSGFAANGKPILDWNGAAAQLTRSGNSWSFSLATPATITYGFRATAPTTMPSGVSGFQQFNSAQIIAAEAALQLWSDVANITFTRVGSGTSGAGAYTNSATILFANYTTETDPASAFAYLAVPGATGSSNLAGDVWVDISESENKFPVFGEWGPHVLAHEIGHAIGINHPGDYDGGSPTYQADAVYWQDARMFTVMSYFGSTNTGGVIPTFSWGPQYHDIAAAQRLYGANMTTRTGDTTYGFNSNSGRSLFEISSASQGVTFSIWDAGGNDTLDLSGYFENAEIDLRPGAFSSAGPTSDRGPALYNISIAVGVTIENAVGGFGNDTLIGNDAANSLFGGAGADSLMGGAGGDVLIGGLGADFLDGGSDIDAASYANAASGVHVVLWQGAGLAGEAAGDTLVSIEQVIGSAFNDTLVGSGVAQTLLGGGGNDRVFADSGNDSVDGGEGDDLLFGQNGDDTLMGGAGGDVLIGGLGADFLDGGSEIDAASYANAASGVHVVLWQGAGLAGEAAGDTLVSIEQVIGSAFNDTLVGSGFAQTLVGGGGNDRVFADSGNDSVDGGDGDDLLFGQNGDDTLTGGAGDDTLIGGAGNDAFIFNFGDGADVIADFGGGPGAGDLIRLVGFVGLFDSFADVVAAATETGPDVFIDLGGGQSVTLQNTVIASLSNDDFAFG